MTGLSSGSDRAAWEKELAEVASLAQRGEQVPAGPPALVSNTQAAVAAYAEAVSDGVAGEVRRRLFRAIWVQGLHLSSAYEVRRLITGLRRSPGRPDGAASTDMTDGGLAPVWHVASGSGWGRIGCGLRGLVRVGADGSGTAAAGPGRRVPLFA